MKELIDEHRGILAHLAQRYFVALNGVLGFDELFHEATIALWQAWERYQTLEVKTASLKTYAWTAVRHSLTEYACQMGATIKVPRQGTAARRAELMIPTLRFDAPIGDGGIDLHSLVALDDEPACAYHADEIERAMQALEALPAADSWLVKQRYMEGRTLQDVSDELGITREGVRQREIRILKRLRSRLKAGRTVGRWDGERRAA